MNRPSTTMATADRGDSGRNRPPPNPPKPRRERRRRPMLVERTILVRIIPRSGLFVRLRAAVALTVIAVTIGLGVAAALSVIVWAVATAIHHAAGN
jgi:hypothetical protein